MNKLTDIQRFQIARTKYNDSVKKVAERFGYSDRYIYEVLKYPNKNPELHRKISKYIQDAEKIEPQTA